MSSKQVNNRLFKCYKNIFVCLLQNELDTVVRMWDNHRIRPSGNGRDLLHGKPFLMYNVPELYLSQDYLHPVDYERVEVILQEDVCLWKSDISCDADLHELCLLVMEDNNLVFAHDISGTIRLYRDLRPLIRDHLLPPD